MIGWFRDWSSATNALTPSPSPVEPGEGCPDVETGWQGERSFGYQPEVRPGPVGRGGGSSRAAARIAARTPAKSSWTASFVKRRTRNPFAARSRSRSASRSGWVAWTSPSTSIASRRSTQQKSSTNGPTGCWRRNFNPSSLRPRSSFHRRSSAPVSRVRSSRAAATLCQCVRSFMPAVSHTRRMRHATAEAWRREQQISTSTHPSPGSTGEGLGVRAL